MKNKVCIVTGATRGIGKEIAGLFADNSACVYALGRTYCNEETFTEERRRQGVIRPLFCDVTDAEQIHRAVCRIKKNEGKIDVLVNNAGVEYNELIGMLHKGNTEQMFRVNVFGMMEMVQNAARVMMRQKNGGSIINISSMVGIYGNEGQSAYAASKGAVIAFTKSAAKELAPYRIRVNSVAPGLTDTEMMRQADRDKLQARIAQIRIGRLADVKDIAQACLFFASDFSEYISGQVMGVDGCARL